MTQTKKIRKSLLSLLTFAVIFCVLGTLPIAAESTGTGVYIGGVELEVGKYYPIVNGAPEAGQASEPSGGYAYLTADSEAATPTYILTLKEAEITQTGTIEIAPSYPIDAAIFSRSADLRVALNDGSKIRIDNSTADYVYGIYAGSALTLEKTGPYGGWLTLEVNATKAATQSEAGASAYGIYSNTDATLCASDLDVQVSAVQNAFGISTAEDLTVGQDVTVDVADALSIQGVYTLGGMTVEASNWLEVNVGSSAENATVYGCFHLSDVKAEPSSVIKVNVTADGQGSNCYGIVLEYNNAAASTFSGAAVSVNMIQSENSAPAFMGAFDVRHPLTVSGGDWDINVKTESSGVVAYGVICTSDAVLTLEDGTELDVDMDCAEGVNAYGLDLVRGEIRGGTVTVSAANALVIGDDPAATDDKLVISGGYVGLEGGRSVLIYGTLEIRGGMLDIPDGIDQEATGVLTVKDGMYVSDADGDRTLLPASINYENIRLIESADSEYEIYVAGKKVTATNRLDILGDDSAKYDAVNNVLTLTNADITGAAAGEMRLGIYIAAGPRVVRDTFTVHAIGNNTVKASKVPSGWETAMEFHDYGKLRLMGDTLTLLSDCYDEEQENYGSAALYLYSGDLEIDGLTLFATAGKSTTAHGAIRVEYGDVDIVNDAKVYANYTLDGAGNLIPDPRATGSGYASPMHHGIVMNGSDAALTVDGSTLYAYSGKGDDAEHDSDNYAIYAPYVTITDSLVTAVSGDTARGTSIAIGTDSFTMSGEDTEVTVTSGNTVAANSTALGVTGDILIHGGKLTATGGNVAWTDHPYDDSGYCPNSYGIGGIGDMTVNGDNTEVIATGGNVSYFDGVPLSNPDAYGDLCGSSLGIGIMGQFEINGGKVTATGGNTAGIIGNAAGTSVGIGATVGFTANGGVTTAQGGTAGMSSIGILTAGTIEINPPAIVNGIGGEAGNNSSNASSAGFAAFGLGEDGQGKVQINGGEINAEGGPVNSLYGDSFGIGASNGNNTVSGGTVEISGGNTYADGGVIGQNGYGSSYGIGATNGVFITGGNLFATGGDNNGAGSSFGIGSDSNVELDGSSQTVANGGSVSGNGGYSLGIGSESQILVDSGTGLEAAGENQALGTSGLEGNNLTNTSNDGNIRVYDSDITDWINTKHISLNMFIKITVETVYIPADTPVGTVTILVDGVVGTQASRGDTVEVGIEYDGTNYVYQIKAETASGVPVTVNDRRFTMPNEPVTVTVTFVERYGLWVGGVEVTALNQNDIFGDMDDGETARYDPSIATLTLDGATVTETVSNGGTAYGILATNGLTLRLTGENAITLSDTSHELCAIAVLNGDLTVMDDGLLHISLAEENDRATGMIVSDGSLILNESELTLQNGALRVKNFEIGGFQTRLKISGLPSDVTAISLYGEEGQFSIFEDGITYYWTDTEENAYFNSDDKALTEADLRDANYLDIFGVSNNSVGSMTEKYTVTFLPGEGTGNAVSETAYLNQVYLLPENQFTAPAGKHFSHWQLEDNADAKYEPFDAYNSASAVFTAIWADNEVEYGASPDGTLTVGLLRTALDAANDENGTVKYIRLLKNNLEISTGSAGEWTLDLNGKTLIGDITVVSGKLTLTDTAGGKLIQRAGVPIFTITVLSGASCILEGGTYSNDTVASIYVDENAELLMRGGTAENGIDNAGALTIEGGTILLKLDRDMIYMDRGSLDLTNHPAPEGITFYVRDDITVEVKLPEGYGMLDSDGKVATELEPETGYIVNKLRRPVDYSAPSVSNIPAKHWQSAEAVIEDLPTEITATLDNNTDTPLTITWSVSGTFDPAPRATNTFAWTVKVSDYEGIFDFSNGVPFGTVEMTNAALYEIVIVTASDEITYNGETYDVSDLFAVEADGYTGALSYTVLSDRSTGIGTLNGSALTVTRAGEIVIRLTAPAKDHYQAAQAEATLRVSPAAQTILSSTEALEWMVGDVGQAHAATAKGTLSYEIADPAVATIGTDGKITALTAGETEVIVKAAATDLYLAAEIRYPLTVRKHIHVWKYTANGARITAVCEGTTACTAVGEQYFELLAPENAVYNGQLQIATVVGAIDGVQKPPVDVACCSVSGCILAMEHTNSITVDGVTATVNYTIRPVKIKDLIRPEHDDSIKTHWTGAEAVIEHLPHTVEAVTADSGLLELAIEWTLVGSEFLTAPGATNRFTWTVKPSEYNRKYDVSAVTVSGTVQVVNADPTEVVLEGHIHETVYDGYTFDVSTLFTVDANAGEATYTVLSDKSTGAGTLNGSILTVTRAGKIEIRLNTAAHGVYGAAQAEATLIVDPATQSVTVDTSDRTAVCHDALEAREVTAQGKVTYESSDPTVASVDAETGKITAHKAGTATIRIKVAATELYRAAEKSYLLTVGHKTDLAWSTDAEYHWHACPCGERLDHAVHTDDDGDSLCDECDRDLTACEHIDADEDHRCDLCHETVSDCGDHDDDHKCDICGELIYRCRDRDYDHICDVCGGAVGAHEAGRDGHSCDHCGETVSACADGDHDHYCDACGVRMSEHKQSETWGCDESFHWNVCSICGETLVAKSHHTLGAAATCETDQSCTLCGYVFAKKTGHSYGSEWKSDGTNHWRECHCGAKTDIGTHGFGQKVTDDALKARADCVNAAEYYESCTVCGHKGEKTFRSGEARGHLFTHYWPNRDATCTADGTKTASCNRCDATDTVVHEGSTLGHYFENYVANGDATCEADGTESAKCVRCDETNTRTDEGSKLFHRYDGGKCALCGAKDPNGSALTWLWVTLAVVGLGGGGFAVYWFFIRKKRG